MKFLKDFQDKMKTIYDNELISYIKYNHLSHVIKVDEQTDEVVKNIEENFVMGFSGIDWEQNEVIYSQKLDSDLEKYLDEAKIFLEKVRLLFPDFIGEKVFIIGDNLTNLSYEMTFEYFLNTFDQFLSIPQDIYIWFADSKKCINFSFENEVYFG